MTQRYSARVSLALDETGGNPVPSLFIVLGILRAEPVMTRPELVERTGLGRKVVAQRVDDLIRAGFVTEGAIGPSKGGRPPTQVAFRPEAGFVLVAELGSTALAVGITDLTGRLLVEREDATAYTLGPEVVLGRVEGLWDELLAELGVTAADVMAIGIGVLGPVEPSSGVTMDLRVRSGWARYPLRDRLAARYDAPTWVENEVNLMAVGERRGRPPGTADDLVFLKVDAGVGAGLLSGGRLVRGKSGVAGEVGHVRVTLDPEVRCWCGNTGCLAEVASARAAARAVDRSNGIAEMGELQHGDERLTMLFASADAGDPEAVRLLAAAGEALGVALAGLINVFNPVLVVIGGVMIGAGDHLLEPLRRSLAAAAFPAAADGLEIAVSRREDRAGLVGAAVVAIDGLLSPEQAHRWLPA